MPRLTYDYVRYGIEKITYFNGMNEMCDENMLNFVLLLVEILRNHVKVA